MLDTATRSVNSSSSPSPNIAEFMTADGRFDMERLRAAGLEGSIDLSGFRARLDPQGNGLRFERGDGQESSPLPAEARGSDDDKWWGGFGPGGVDGYVSALLAADGVVYVGGSFTIAGGVAANNIASWDGREWRTLGSGTNGEVGELAIYQGKLVVGGGFTEAGGVMANRVATWDGASWGAIGDGVNGWVSALVEMGGDLYAGGEFTQAGTASVNRIARWDGASWSALGSGVVGTVHALIEYGGALVVGGQFKVAGGLDIENVAQWDGTTWSPLGTGVSGGGLSSRALAFTVYNGALIVAGYFSQAGGLPADNIASWDGASWSSLGTGVNSWVLDVTVHGNSLVAVGYFSWAGGQSARNVASWNGTSWSALGTGLNAQGYSSASAVAVLDGEVVVGGFFTRAGEINAQNIASWTGVAWRPLGHGTSGEVLALAAYDGAIVAAGAFTQAGGAAANFIAQWDGDEWSPLGTGTDYPVVALTVYDGSLIAGGGFGEAGGQLASCIARWDGSVWHGLGSGLGGWVLTLTVWNGFLVAGGEFGSAGGVLADHIAKWDGSTWSSIGGGANHYVRALATFDGDLYAAGSFTQAGGVPAYIVARWDGAAWSALGAGLSTTIHYAYVRALAAYDEGLIVGGAFTLAGGQPVNNIARWDGSNWSPLGTGIEGPGVSGFPYGEVWALAEHNGDLIVAGDFTLAGGTSANGIARWDGSTWGTLGSGMDPGERRARRDVPDDPAFTGSARACEQNAHREFPTGGSTRRRARGRRDQCGRSIPLCACPVRARSRPELPGAHPARHGPRAARAPGVPPGSEALCDPRTGSATARCAGRRPRSGRRSERRSEGGPSSARCNAKACPPRPRSSLPQRDSLPARRVTARTTNGATSIVSPPKRWRGRFTPQGNGRSGTRGFVVQLSQRRRALFGAATLALLALLSSGCGGGSVPLPELGASEVGDRTGLQERGAYIVRNAAVCGHCHAAEPLRNPDGPLSGGYAFEDWRLGTIRAANLTPDSTGIGAWSEEEIVRALRTGEGRDEEVLAPVMPYAWFHAMSDRDALAVALYLKSQPPVQNVVEGDPNLVYEAAKVFFLGPEEEDSQLPVPERAPTAEYGRYLANHVALCGDCHTPRGGVTAGPQMDRLFEGDDDSEFPVNPANLTPDSETGIGTWSEADFLHTLRTGVEPDGDSLHSFMPWRQVGRMTDDDLKAIYRYLMSLEPVRHEIPEKEPEP